MWQPLAGVEAGERLVEDDHVGVVDDGLGHLDPLAHALRVGRASAGGRRGRARPTPRARRGGVGRLGRALEHRRQPHELEGRSASRTRLLLGHQPDAAGQRRRSRCGSPPRTRTVPRDGRVSPHSMRSMVDLPAPLGPSSAVTPGPMRKRRRTRRPGRRTTSRRGRPRSASAGGSGPVGTRRRRVIASPGCGGSATTRTRPRDGDDHVADDQGGGGHRGGGRARPRRPARRRCGRTSSRGR